MIDSLADLDMAVLVPAGAPEVEVTATGLIGTMTRGGADAIASRGARGGDDEPLDRAAMEAGND